ncbi:MAG: MFS transporter, partial [Erysipelotrichaceae bacterium]
MKLTKVEKSWVLYDVANSAFTLIMSATIPIYFAVLYNGAITGVPATTFFGFSTSISVAIIALLSPFMGAVADHKGLKKKLFVGSILIGVLGGLAFTAVSNW